MMVRDRRTPETCGLRHRKESSCPNCPAETSCARERRPLPSPFLLSRSPDPEPALPRRPCHTLEVDDIEGFERALAALQAEGVSVDEPMMVLVNDARLGRVSILHGTSETVVEDRALVGKIVRAKSRTKA